MQKHLFNEAKNKWMLCGSASKSACDEFAESMSQEGGVVANSPQERVPSLALIARTIECLRNFRLKEKKKNKKKMPVEPVELQTQSTINQKVSGKSYPQHDRKLLALVGKTVSGR